MKPFINKLLALGFLLTVQVVYAAEQPTPVPHKDYPACFAAWDNKLNTLQTRFIQTTDYDGTLISQSRGRISYTKTGPKLRLDNLEGEEIAQSALTDKKKIYILDEKGKEISKISWEDWLIGQPNQALFDFGNYTQLLAKHTVQVQKQNTKQAVLKLAPKTPTENYMLYVTIRTVDCFPEKITIESDLIKTTAVLMEIQINQDLPADLFKELK